MGHNIIGRPNLESNRTLHIKGLTREQIADKRKKGLCFLCDEPYTMGHQCKKPHLFMMLPSDNCMVDCDIDDCCEEEVRVQEIQGEQQEAHITLHALSRHSANNTIRILGMANVKFLRILVDSGSTNNFMDPHARA